MPKYRGVIHVHSSDFSPDAKFSFEEVANYFKENGYNFVCMTEHSDFMNSKKLASLVSKCKKLSGKKFLLIPGIELTTSGKVHTLGLGLKKYHESDTVGENIKFINKNKAISILSHPKKYHIISVDQLNEINGIEIWNFEYDGMFPRVSSIDILKKLRKRNPNIFGFVGLDFHRNIHKRKIYLEVNARLLTEKEILNSLRKGNFTMKNIFVSINSRGNINIIQSLLFRVFSLIFDILRSTGIFVFSAIRKISSFR